MLLNKIFQNEYLVVYLFQLLLLYKRLNIVIILLDIFVYSVLGNGRGVYRLLFWYKCISWQWCLFWFNDKTRLQVVVKEFKKHLFVFQTEQKKYYQKLFLLIAFFKKLFCI